MSMICDRSPCTPLLKALGIWIFGSSEKPGFLILAATDSVDMEVPVEYCPFCGTRLEDVQRVLIEKFVRPRKRSRKVKPAA